MQLQNDAHCVTMRSEIRKGIHLVLIFDCSTHGGNTTVVETVSVSGMGIMGRLFLSFLRKKHLQLAQNIVKALQ